MTDGIGFKKQFNDRLVWLESLLNPLWCNLMSRHALKKKKVIECCKLGYSLLLTDEKKGNV